MNTLICGGLLSAAMLMGQTSSVPAPPTLPMQAVPAQPQRGPIMSWFTREDRPVLSRITSWFKRDQGETPAQPTKGIFRRDPAPTPVPIPALPVTPASAPASNDFPRRLPNPMSKGLAPGETIVLATPGTVKTGEGPKTIVQTTSQLKTVPSNAPSPISPQFASKIGRDEKFAWITGQLEMESGVYVLYYATPETVDRYHGRIVLQTQQVDMKGLHRGDLVSAQGECVQRPTLHGMQPTYRLTSATLVERKKQ